MENSEKTDRKWMQAALDLAGNGEGHVHPNPLVGAVIVKDGEVIKTSNHAGGIMGGISDGSEIILRAHIKPTPSISQPQQTVTKDKEPLSLEIHGRHDPVIVPRAVVVVESMAAITLADALFVNMSSQMDKVRDFYRK